jgi:DNA-binding NarL/FixJ family response regulator
LRIVAVVCCCPEVAVASHTNDLVTSHGNAESYADVGAAGTRRIQLRRPDVGIATGTQDLNSNDRHLLELVARGLSDNRIGDELHMSGRAVRKHVVRLRQTLGVGSREELAAWAGTHGLYQPSTLSPQATLVERTAA